MPAELSATQGTINRPAVLLQSTETSKGPFQQNSMYLLGLFPTSASAHKFVVTPMTYFASYDETRAREK
ncbi:MAG TPA: hypothetical protein ACHBX0_09340 [Arsenophonus sp.]